MQHQQLDTIKIAIKFNNSLISDRINSLGIWLVWMLLVSTVQSKHKTDRERPRSRVSVNLCSRDLLYFVGNVMRRDGLGELVVFARVICPYGRQDHPVRQLGPLRVSVHTITKSQLRQDISAGVDMNSAKGFYPAGLYLCLCLPCGCVDFYKALWQVIKPSTGQVPRGLARVVRERETEIGAGTTTRSLVIRASHIAFKRILNASTPSTSMANSGP